MRTRSILRWRLFTCGPEREISPETRMQGREIHFQIFPRLSRTSHQFACNGLSAHISFGMR